MQQPPLPFSEPWHTTALRTGSLALVIGAGAGLLRRDLAVVPLITVLALWFTLGGHFLEVLFRNRLRQLISGGPIFLAIARVAYWFFGGAALFEGAVATRGLLAGRTNVPFSWWMAGASFVAAELLIHLGLRARGQYSIYDRRG
jgi:hypothetical protein